MSKTETEDEARQARLQRIVQKTVETFVDNCESMPSTIEQFQSACQKLDQTNLSNIAEERSLARVCGYPLCISPIDPFPKDKRGKPLQNSQPRYRVLRGCGIFDVSERRFFCSDGCFERFCLVRQQLPEQPLWLTGDRPRRQIVIRGMEEEIKGVVGVPIDVSEFDLPAGIEQCSLSPPTPDKDEKQKQNSIAIDATMKPSFDPEQSLAKLRTKYNQKKSDGVQAVQALLVEAKPIRPNDEGNSKVAHGKVESAFSDAIQRVERWLNDDSLHLLRNWAAVSCDAEPTGGSPKTTEMDERVAQFFAGDREARKVRFQDGEQTSAEMETEVIRELPMVDALQQTKRRRQILIEQIAPTWKRVLPHILNPTIDEERVFTDRLRKLIDTIHLSPNDVVIPKMNEKLAVTLILLLLVKETSADLKTEETQETKDPLYFDGLVEGLGVQREHLAAALAFVRRKVSV